MGVGVAGGEMGEGVRMGGDGNEKRQRRAAEGRGQGERGG